MQLFNISFSREARERDAVLRDAGALRLTWGDAAHDVARDLSWREDAGLLDTPVPGHWGRVYDAIGAQIGVVPPSADAWRKAA